MIRANVGLSRKISREYQSTGYSINIEGDVAVSADDTEATLAKVAELFQLAEEALNVEIDRDQGKQAIGNRDKPTAITKAHLNDRNADDGNLMENPYEKRLDTTGDHHRRRTIQTGRP
ncbi:MAG TPA: hypothetical protein PKA06_06140 [Gemmatales bacterium]|nr:hypothetical protein [Gemmatales bacterium]